MDEREHGRQVRWSDDDGEADDYFYTFGEQCQERVDRIREQLLEKNPAPDKETRPDAWRRHMNAILRQAEEIVKEEMIYNKNA